MWSLCRGKKIFSFHVKLRKSGGEDGGKGGGGRWVLGCRRVGSATVAAKGAQEKQVNIVPTLTPGEWSMMKIYALDAHVYY
jgi:hypothetical protein